MTYHVEVRGHVRIGPLLVESKRTAGKTGNEDDSRLLGVTSGLSPDLGAIRRGHIDGKGGGGEGKSGKKRSKLHGDAWVATPWQG